MKPFLILGLVCVATAPLLAEDFTDLSKRLPENINAIGLIDLASLNKSAVGQAGGWADKPELANLPTTVGQLVIGGHYNPASGAHEWRYGVVRLVRDLPMSYLVKKYGGTEIMVGTHPAVVGQNNLAYVELDKGLLGLHPANSRQDLARWVRHSDSSSTLVVNPYLKDFVKESSGAQVRFLLDTADLFDPAAIKAEMANLKDVGGDAVTTERFTKQLTGLRGIAFAIRAGDDLRGTLRFDFTEDTAGMGPLAMPVARALLSGQGLWLADFDGWKAEARGKSIYLEGTMTESGLRQSLTALLTLPQPLYSMQPEEPAVRGDATTASRRYLNGTVNLLDDLRKQMRNLRTSNEFAHWYDHTARKLDQLPPEFVDPELTQFGGTVADKLRALSASVRGEDVDFKKLAAHKRSATTVIGGPGLSSWAGEGGPYGPYWGSYIPPGTYVNNNLAEVAAAKAEVASKAAKDRAEVWRSIDIDLAEMRRALAKRYASDFGGEGSAAPKNAGAGQNKDHGK